MTAEELAALPELSRIKCEFDGQIWRMIKIDGSWLLLHDTYQNYWVAENFEVEQA